MLLVRPPPSPLPAYVVYGYPVVHDQGRNRVRHEERQRTHFFGWEDIQRKGEIQNLGREGGVNPVSPLVTNPGPP